jgi:hypothetical protein
VPGGWGALRGGIGVGIVMGSAVIGIAVSLVLGHGPGSVLGLFIVAGTVVAALVVRPTAVRMLLPVPALCYVIAALAVGVITDSPSDTSKAALAVAAAQWIAAGFLTMVLATALAVVLTAVRWFLWHRSRPVPDGPVRPARAGSRRKRRVSREDFEDPDPYGPYGAPVNLGSQRAVGNYGFYDSQGGIAGPAFESTGGLGGRGDFEPGALGGQGGYADTGGLGGQGGYGNSNGLGGQGGYGTTGGLGGQGRYGNAGGPPGVRRAGRWGDPGAPDPGSPGSWPEALRTSAAAGALGEASGW